MFLFLLRKELEMLKIKYPYPRTDMTVRCSADLLKLVHEMAFSLGCSVQDVAIVCILDKLDASQSLPDWIPLPDNLK